MVSHCVKIMAVLSLSGCATIPEHCLIYDDKEEVKECAWEVEETKRRERREKWFYYRQQCERTPDRVWVCSGGYRRQWEKSPWMYCGCDDPRNIL